MDKCFFFNGWDGNYIYNLFFFVELNGNDDGGDFVNRNNDDVEDNDLFLKWRY